MLIPLVLAVQSLVGVSTTCTGGRPCSLSINISVTVMSSSQLAIDTTPTELDNAIVMTVDASYTGSPDAKTLKKRYLVFNPNSEMVDVAYESGTLSISATESTLVIAWPDKYKVPNRRGLLAIASAYRNSYEKGQIVVARLQRKLLIERT